MTISFRRFTLTTVFLTACIFISSPLIASDSRHRLIVLADMGNEPDEEQQIVHLLHHANEVDLEGLIAVTGKYLRKDPQPELFYRLIGGYAKVVENFRIHADGWPDAAALQSVVAEGQYRYGMYDVKPGNSSPGSQRIARALQKDDPRPLYVVVNAGSNTLAQALLDMSESLDKKTFAAARAKLRVFENGAQDNAGAWIMHQWPDIHWVRSNYQTYAYGGPSGDGGQDNKGQRDNLGPHTWEPFEYSGLGQHLWGLKHLKANNGELAGFWPIRQFHRGGVHFIEGGGTIPWLAAVNRGLYSIDHPYWGGWGGRYTREKVKNYGSKHKDVRNDEKQYTPFYMYGETQESWTNPEDGTEYKDSLFAAVWRWRRAMYNNQRARFDWGNKSYANANHHPFAVIDGDKTDRIIEKKVRAGERVVFDASDSVDPDNDTLTFHWWVYREAGTYSGNVELQGERSARVELLMPEDVEKDQEIHLILEVVDDNKITRLTDYRRVLLWGR